ncbi:nuclear transport factor 2 family protein [Emcibacter sp.]|uniref:nuclear transport factor 2 family protein n=1 Tax=Emcibacter sp. TaxID=1979954 RepID=UPI002AA73484|nr:nuclear transport factor 2 family protein [Emcibacter sp.]
MDTNLYNQIKNQINHLYELTAAGKWDEVEEQLTDDFCIIEADSLPFGGTFNGKNSLQRLYTHVFEFWEDPDLEFHDMTISENNVVCLLTFHATSRHNGERLAMKITEVFHLRGDKICGITPYYFDTAAIAKATGTPLD